MKLPGIRTASSALPKVHEYVKPDSPAPYKNLLEAYREIIPTIMRQAKDPTFFVKRQIPTPTFLTEAFQESTGQTLESWPISQGWVEACTSEELKLESVLRFDYGNSTYAIYRLADGKVFASDGKCTHSNAHLAEGMVSGHLIECAKHNGRFDIRDGSPQRPPVRLPLRTYAVKELGNKVYINLAEG